MTNPVLDISGLPDSAIELERDYPPALLTVGIRDPDWMLLKTTFQVDENGMMREYEVEYPQESGEWWRLRQISGQPSTSSDLNLTLMFYERTYCEALDRD